MKDFVIRIKFLFIYDSMFWKIAKQWKIQSLNDYNIWVVIDCNKLPIRVRILGGRFVYWCK